MSTFNTSADVDSNSDQYEATGGTIDTERTFDVAIVGGGVAGLSAGIYTARAGLDTLIVDDRDRGSILRRNAHLENVPGFPAGVNARLFLDMTRDQAARAGCRFLDGFVTDVRPAEEEGIDGFGLALDTGEVFRAEYVIAASWSDADYLDELGLDIDDRGSKRFVRTTEDGPAAGRTGVAGLYAAGRLADGYHQTVVAAGNGARVALTLIHDAEVPFYHDWTAPEGYFTDRDRELPPAIEEISDEERRRRERESMAVMREYFADPHPDEPTPHPSLVEDN